MKAATDDRQALPAIAELDQVGRTFTTPAAPVTALQHATFAVQPGDSVAIMGPSGAGKSTLLNVLGLLDRPTSGRYQICGLETTALNEAVRSELRSTYLGFVFQHFHLLPDRSASENVELGLMYKGISRRSRVRLAAESLERVGLGNRSQAYPPTLSGGECQRVAIARAIATSPALLLCDEPTGNLDQATSAEVMARLTQLNRDGLTLIVVTHDPAVAARMARNLVLVDGEVTEKKR